MSTEKSKTSAAALSVASNSILVAGKLAVGLIINSVSVIGEALHSAIDLIASLAALLAVRRSGKPPDTQHPFGHGKLEGISSAFEGFLIFVAIAVIAGKAVWRIVHGGEVEKVDLGLAVMAISAVANLIVSRHLFRTANKTNSLALEADALHLSTDVLTSAGVFLGLLVIRFTGWHLIDPLIALVVAAAIGHAAYGILRRSVADLMDERLSPAETAIIEEVLQEHEPHFIGFHDLRSRRSGGRREIDLHLVQCRFISVEDAHLVCDHLEEELEKKLPGIHVTIHVEPCDKDCDGEKNVCRINKDQLGPHLGDSPKKGASSRGDSSEVSDRQNG